MEKWQFSLEVEERGIVPVPKKKSKDTDACTPDDFRGISVVSVAYKAMCKIVQMHLDEFAEKQQLLAEEQAKVASIREEDAETN